MGEGVTTQAVDVQRGWHVWAELGPSQAPRYLLKESPRSEGKEDGPQAKGTSAPPASPTRALNDRA